MRLFLEHVGAFGPRREVADKLAVWLEAVTENTNIDTLPEQVFLQVRQEMRRQGVSTRGMAALRGTSYGGSSHFKFAPSRAVLKEYAELLDSDPLRDLCRDTLFWDRVVAIKPAGKEEVFDLTVPGPASWLADGLVSHNSGAIEQDADLIMFLYREEVYDRETINKGIAEAIIGKQRNGPIGSARLAFLPQFTRFENLARE